MRPPALAEPFKHAEALEAARYEVERIAKAMRGEDAQQTDLDPEQEALRRDMRPSFPKAPQPGKAPIAASAAVPGTRVRGSQLGRDEALER